MTEFALEFCTIAMGSSWNEPALKIAFWQGLDPRVLTELACSDKQTTLDTLIDLSIHLDNLLCSRPTLQHAIAKTPSFEAPTPMDICCTRLTSSERDCRRKEGRCFYCGKATHLLAQCPVRSKGPRTPAGAEGVLSSNTPPLVSHSKCSSGMAFKIDVSYKIFILGSCALCTHGLGHSRELHGH